MPDRFVMSVIYVLQESGAADMDPNYAGNTSRLVESGRNTGPAATVGLSTQEYSAARQQVCILQCLTSRCSTHAVASSFHKLQWYAFTGKCVITSEVVTLFHLPSLHSIHALAA